MSASPARSPTPRLDARQGGARGLAPAIEAVIALTGIFATLLVLDAADVAGIHLFFLFGAIAMLSVPAILAWRERRFAPFGAEVALPLAVHLTTLQGAIGRSVLGPGLTTHELRVLSTAVHSAFGVALVTIVLSKAFGSRGLLPEVSAYTESDARRQAGLGIVACVITVVLFAAWALMVGYERLASASYAEIYTIGAEQGTFMTFAWPMFHVGPAVLWRALAMWPGRAPRSYTTAAYVFLAVFVLISTRMGVRGPILQLFAAIGLARLGTLRPIKPRTILVATVGMLALSIFIFGIRSDLSRGFRADKTVIAQSAEHTFEAKSAGEFEGIFNNHVEMVRYAGTAIPHREGTTYVDAIVMQIPRQLVGEKPPGLSFWWVRYLDREAANAGASFAFGAFTEGYLNFGPAGAVAQIVALTLGLGLVYRGLASKRLVRPAMAAVVLCYAYHIQRTDFGYTLFVARNILIVGTALGVIDFVLHRTLWRPGPSAPPQDVSGAGQRGRPHLPAQRTVP